MKLHLNDLEYINTDMIKKQIFALFYKQDTKWEK